MQAILEWAGVERCFKLDFGLILDLEEACRGEPLGMIFQRMAAGQFRVGEVYHIIRLGLIGGGLSMIEAKALMASHFDQRPYLQNALVAGEILKALMVGIEPRDSAPDPDRKPERIRFSEAVQVCREFNMAPEDLRRLSFADYLNLMKGWAAGSKKDADPLSEDEFAEMVARAQASGVMN